LLCPLGFGFMLVCFHGRGDLPNSCPKGEKRGKSVGKRKMRKSFSGEENGETKWRAGQTVKRA